MKPPTLVAAGAGSGKTTRIVRAIVERVRAGVAVERIAAVTFTDAAAAELQDRLRASLLAHGLRDEAARVDGASVCTIHRFALTLLQRYPLAAGLPPSVRVLDEVQAAALRRRELIARAGDASDPTVHALLDGLFGAGVGLPEQSWGDGGSALERLHNAVRELLEKCRSVGMDPARVRANGPHAAARVRNALHVHGDAHALDAAMRDALDAAAVMLRAHPSPSFKKDEPFWEALRTTLAARHATPLDHALALAGHELSKRAEPLFAPLVTLADEVSRTHPELRRRVGEGVEALYALTADVMERYADEKQRLGALDFEDMQRMALDLLAGHGPSEGAYAHLVASALPCVVVDEFQDTSPLQFRLFEALRAAGADVEYVGDLKQGIYGFRAADSTLFAALLRRARSHGAPVETLDRSRRSRPELVRLANAMFAPLFRDDFTPLTAENAYTAGACPKAIPSVDLVRGRDALHATLDRLDALVAAETPVLDRDTQRARPMTWNDVAVLAYTHESLRRWGDALRARGVPTVLAARGLYDTLEVSLARHWFRMVSSPRDTAAAAAVLLSELYGLSQRAVTALARAKLLGAPRQAVERAATVPGLDALTDFERRALARCDDDLRACRMAFRQLPVHEAVERALEQTELCDRLSLRATADEAAQLRANVTALVAVARGLVQSADASGEGSATLEGFLLALDRDAERDPWQRGTDAGGVKLVTLHASKGMEYPVVVLDLFAQRMTVRLPRVEVLRPADPEALLGPGMLDACSVQFLPDVGVAPLRAHLRALDDGPARLAAEWTRLLYVAVTRARDHLVLPWRDDAASAKTPTVRALLDGLDAPPDAPSSAPAELTWLGVPVTVLHAPATAPAPAPRPARDLAPWRALVAEPLTEDLPRRELDEVAPRLARVSPSELCQVADCPEVPRLVRFSRGELHELARAHGMPVVVRDIPDAREARALLGTTLPSSQLGKLVHAAVERAALRPDALPSRDPHLAWEVIRAAGAELHGDALAALIVDTLASLRGAVALLGAVEDPSSEVPFVIDLDGTALHGIVDLVVRGRDGLHVVDLKTHLMPRADLARWAAYYRPQLDAYALAITRLAREPVVGRHLAVPAAGALVTLDDAFVPDHAAVSLASWASLLAREVPGPAQDCATCGWNALCRVGRATARGR